MNELTIITNNVPRDVVYGCELSDEIRKDFDYWEPEELDCQSFVKYRGVWYDLGQFMSNHGMPECSSLKAWDGHQGDSYFSGTLVKFVGADCESVIMGTYIQ